MILNFEIPKFTEPLTTDEIKRLCEQLGGDLGTLNLDDSEGCGIVYGEFKLTTSLQDIDSLTNCLVLPVIHDSEFEKGMDKKRQFHCIVIQQEYPKVAIAEMSADNRVKPRLMSKAADLEIIDPSMLVFLFFEKHPKYYIDYNVFPDEEDPKKPQTIFLFEQLPEEGSIATPYIDWEKLNKQNASLN